MRFMDQFSGTLFDLAEGERRKEAGIEQASDMMSRRFLLQKARAIAWEIVIARGQVTADDVYREMDRRGYNPILLGNAAGAIFQEKGFVFHGEWQKSKRTTNHARMNRVWRKA
jgi:hypothetical protein